VPRSLVDADHPERLRSRITLKKPYSDGTVAVDKVVAARLAPFPGLSMGLLETNGHQNYRNWEAMRQRHPAYGAPWTLPEKGVFRLDADFYARSGGIFERSPHYEGLFLRTTKSS
jgi:hypothetical protein